MAAQNVNRAAVFAKHAKHPQPYQASDKYKFLGMYGSTPDMSRRAPRICATARSRWTSAMRTMGMAEW